jgi:hypothetical protein
MRRRRHISSRAANRGRRRSSVPPPKRSGESATRAPCPSCWRCRPSRSIACSSTRSPTRSSRSPIRRAPPLPQRQAPSPRARRAALIALDQMRGGALQPADVIALLEPTSPSCATPPGGSWAAPRVGRRAGRGTSRRVWTPAAAGALRRSRGEASRAGSGRARRSRTLLTSAASHPSAPVRHTALAAMAAAAGEGAAVVVDAAARSPCSPAKTTRKIRRALAVVRGRSRAGDRRLPSWTARCYRSRGTAGGRPTSGSPRWQRCAAVPGPWMPAVFGCFRTRSSPGSPPPSARWLPQSSNGRGSIGRRRWRSRGARACGTAGAAAAAAGVRPRLG